MQTGKIQIGTPGSNATDLTQNNNAEYVEAQWSAPLHQSVDDWNKFEYEFTPTTNTTRISFQNIPSNDGSAVNVDLVSLYELVPSGSNEPAENTVTLTGPDAASFEVVGSELFLKTGVALDHGVKDSYAVTLTTGSVSVTHTLSIADVNDPPSDILLSEDAIPENLPAGTIVGKFALIDPDEGSVFNLRGQRIAPYLKDPLDNNKSPGLFAAIIDKEGVNAIASAGVRKQGSPELLTVNDLVHLGSCAKAMTSTMLATMVAETYDKIMNATRPDGLAQTMPEGQTVFQSPGVNFLA